MSRTKRRVNVKHLEYLYIIDDLKNVDGILCDYSIYMNKWSPICNTNDWHLSPEEFVIKQTNKFHSDGFKYYGHVPKKFRDGINKKIRRQSKNLIKVGFCKQDFDDLSFPVFKHNVHYDWY